MRIGFLGCGSITSIVVELIYRDKLDCKVVSFFDVDSGKAEALRNRFDKNIKVVGGFDSLLVDVDLVVEAASQEAVRDYGVRVLEGGKDLIVLSVGALSHGSLLEEMKDKAGEAGAKIYIPSGAVVGVDGVKTAGLGEMGDISLVTTKPPESLGVRVEKRTVLYEGPADDGVRKFPQNVNVAATLGLAAGLDRVKLKVIADPEVEENIHEIHVSGAFGEFTINLLNKPSKLNPKTSYIAALSVVALLKRILDVVEVGT